MSTWRTDLAILIFVAACCVMTLVHCEAGGARKAILAASQATEAAVQQVREHCRWLAKTGCKSNPCEALTRCHRAERLLNAGADSLQAGLGEINEVIE